MKISMWFLKRWTLYGIFLGTVIGIYIAHINKLFTLAKDYFWVIFLIIVIYASISFLIAILFIPLFKIIFSRKNNTLEIFLTKWTSTLYVFVCLMVYVFLSVRGSNVGSAQLLKHVVFAALTSLVVIILSVSVMDRFILKRSAGLLLTITFSIVLCHYGASLVWLSKEQTKVEKGIQSVHSRETGVKVLLLGVDAARWKTVNEMVKSGDLPNMEKMMKNGVSATLPSEEPIESPIIWTTIITGKHYTEHGIRGFNERVITKFPKIWTLPENIGLGFVVNVLGMKEYRSMCISSYRRKVKAMWNILSDSGKSVGIVGWTWATWPAEKVNGYTVTKEATMYYDIDQAKDPELSSNGMTYPAELDKKILPLIVDSHKLDAGKILGIESFTLESAAELNTKVGLASGAIESVVSGLSYDMSAVSILLNMREEKPIPDFQTLYLKILDITGHLFYQFYEPDFEYEKKPAQEGIDRFQNLIPKNYILVDSWIGEIFQDVDENTVVIICSDHGMEASNAMAPDVTGMHTLDGILIMKGGPIKAGAKIENPTLYDLMPTMLYLLGEPVAKDMKGRILSEVIEDSFLSAFPPEYIDSYEFGYSPTHLKYQIVDSMEQNNLKQLRNLKYIK